MTASKNSLPLIPVYSKCRTENKFKRRLEKELKHALCIKHIDKQTDS